MGELLAQTVAGEVRAEIARQQMPRAVVAARTGMSLSALNRRLSGEVAFAIDELHLVAVTLGKPPAYFVREPDREVAEAAR